MTRIQVLCVCLGIATVALLGTTIYFYGRRRKLKEKKCPKVAELELEEALEKAREELNKYTKILKRKELMNEDGSFITPFACGPGTKNAPFVFEGRGFCLPCASSEFCPGTRRMSYVDPNFTGPTQLSQAARNRLR